MGNIFIKLQSNYYILLCSVVIKKIHSLIGMLKMWKAKKKRKANEKLEVILQRVLYPLSMKILTYVLDRSKIYKDQKHTKKTYI